jgi:hypothetical protein
MKELEQIVTEVKQVLALKEEEVQNANSANSYVHSTLENRRLEVELFENSTKNVTTDPTQKGTIIENFRKGAKGLIEQINKIEV